MIKIDIHNQNILNAFSYNKEFLNEIILFIKEQGIKYGAYHFYIGEEWEPVLFMTEEIKSNTVITNSYLNNITYATRFKNLMEYFNDVLRENQSDNNLIEQAEYYFMLGKYLQDYQIEHCEDKDNWYFKNLGLL